MAAMVARLALNAEAVGLTFPSMKFPQPLISGHLLRRYKRFLADVEMEGGATVTAHCPNSGSMLGLCGEGFPVWLSTSYNPKRKLAHTLELVEAGGTLVGVNTHRANTIAEEAVREGLVPELAGYRSLRREVKYAGNSRIDLLLEDEAKPPCYVEVKSVTLRRNTEEKKGIAEFPDAVTARGTKHLHALAEMVREGARAVMLYLAQRGDCREFRIADDIDPAYAKAYEQARTAGVEILRYDCKLSTAGIVLGGPFPLARNRLKNT
jgi:sugar fermentation stimulation protein A|tara:strand:- start:3041 stop:3835 length:795 start_codon:yes stop_codon:yes gene_type:complete